MKLPKVLYIEKEKDGNEEYFVCQEKAEDFAVQGEKHTVGIYKFYQTITVKTKVVIE